MEKLNTNNAPAAIGPYSQAVKTGNLLFTSGQIALDPNRWNCWNNNRRTDRTGYEEPWAILKEAGATYENAVKTVCFLDNMDDFGAFNEIYGKYFTGKPARSCVAVKTLPKNVLCEVEVIAEI